MGLFRGQYLLTSHNADSILTNWKRVKIGKFNLLFHPDVHYTAARGEIFSLYLIGDIYDWVNPFQTNKQVLDSLKKHESLETLLDELGSYAGRFVLFVKSKSDIKVVPDACAQFEVYYDSSYTAFGSQPKILELVTKHEPHTDRSAINFFRSRCFNNRRVFFGNKTHVKNILHLLPNHHISITEEKVVRDYPLEPLTPLPLNEVVGRTTVMLKGFLKAIAHRDRIAIPVTAGYGSRLLFLASLDLPCIYYVHKFAHMSNTHYDIIIPNQLTELYGKEFSIIPDIPKDQTVFPEGYLASIDFPRKLNMPAVTFDDHVYINGSISKVARNQFGNSSKPTSRFLAMRNGYRNYRAVTQEYEKWIKTNEKEFTEHGYHLLDMFYWEEKTGNRDAKAQTEGHAMGYRIISPFNSRLLLTILLSAERKLRDPDNNILYQRIAELLSPDAQNIPINPNPKRKVIGTMKKLRLYPLYNFFNTQIQLRKP